MPNTTIDTGDATELAELLQFLGHWLASDHQRLDASLHTFVGDPRLQPATPTRRPAPVHLPPRPATIG